MSISFTCAAELAAPPAVAYAALLDHTSWRHWMPGLVSITPLTEGPLAPGSRWRETRKMYGHEASEVFELRALDPGRRIELLVDGSQGSSGCGRYRFTQRLEPTPQGSRLVLEGLVESDGVVAGAMAWLFQGFMRRACQADLDAFAAYLASGAPAAPDMAAATPDQVAHG